MTITSPLPPHATGPYGPAAGWAPVPTPAAGWAPVPTPAAVQQGLAPVRRARLSPGQVWTLVVAGVIAVVALVVGITVGSSGDSSREDAIRDLLDGGSGVTSYDYSEYDDSGCWTGC